MKKNPQPNPLELDPMEEALERLPQYRLSRRAIAAFYRRLAARRFAQATSSLSLNPFTMKRATSWGVAALVVAFAFATVASVSPTVTRGHFLYPLKRTTENVELFFAGKGLPEVRTHVKFSQRRLQELQTLFSSGTPSALAPAASAQDEEVAPEQNGDDTAVSETAEEVVEEIEAAMDEAEAIEQTDEAAEALDVIVDALEEQSETVAELAELVESGAAASEVVQEALSNAAAALEENEAVVTEAREAVADALENAEAKVALALQTSSEAKKAGAATGRHEEKATEALQNAVAAQKAMLEKLAELGVSQEDADKLVQRVADKFAAAQEACESGNFGKCRGLSRATESLTNNVKSFESRSGDEEDEEDASEDEAEDAENENDEEEDEETSDESTDESTNEEDATETDERDGTDNGQGLENAQQASEKVGEAQEKAEEASAKADERRPE